MFLCPFMSTTDLTGHCTDNCALYCYGDNVCAFKMIALELLKKGEV